MSLVTITYSHTDDNDNRRGGCLNVNPDNVESAVKMFEDAGYTDVETHITLPLVTLPDDDVTLIDDEAAVKAAKIATGIDPVVGPEVGTRVYHLEYGSGTVIVPDNPDYLYVRFGLIIKRLDLLTQMLFPVLS